MRRDKKEKKEGKKTGSLLFNIFKIALLLLFLVIIFLLAPNYEKKDTYDSSKINLIINNNNVTKRLKHDLWINEKNVIYLSKEDAANYFDQYIYIDKDENQIITTYGEKVGVLPIEKNIIKINDVSIDILSGAVQKDGVYYLPITSMSKVYNVDVKYIKEEKILTLDSLDKELIKADVSKNCSVKYKNTSFSKTVDKIKQGEKVICIEKQDNNWTKSKKIITQK